MLYRSKDAEIRTIKIRVYFAIKSMQVMTYYFYHAAREKYYIDTYSIYSNNVSKRSILLPLYLTAPIVCYSINYGIFYFDPGIFFSDFLFSSYDSTGNTINQIN